MNLQGQLSFTQEEERQYLHELIEENGQKPLYDNVELMMQSQKLDEIIVRLQKEPKV